MRRIFDVSVFNADYMVAAVAILVAMIFDVLDGKSARLTNSTSHFGLEYDSLSDVVSFGVAPGLLIYSWALSGQGTFGVAVMFAYVAMGAVRLARFNSTAAGAGQQVLYRVGYSVAAGVVASLVIFDHYSVRIGTEVKPFLVLIITLILSYLMVSTIKYRSFKDMKFRGGSAFYLSRVGNFGAHARSRLAPSHVICHLCRVRLARPGRTARRTSVQGSREASVAKN